MIASAWTRVSSSLRKTNSISHSLAVILDKPLFNEAVYMLNEYIMSDSTMKQLMGGDFVIEPIVAFGSEEKPLVPYIRYTSIPAIGPIWTVRTDIVRYYVGHRTYAEAGKLLERLQELLIVDDSGEILPFKSDKFRVQSIDFLGGINPSGPDQESGVIERGLSIALIYTRF